MKYLDGINRTNHLRGVQPFFWQGFPGSLNSMLGTTLPKIVVEIRAKHNFNWNLHLIKIKYS